MKIISVKLFSILISVSEGDVVYKYFLSTALATLLFNLVKDTKRSISVIFLIGTSDPGETSLKGFLSYFGPVVQEMFICLQKMDDERGINEH